MVYKYKISGFTELLLAAGVNEILMTVPEVMPVELLLEIKVCCFGTNVNLIHSTFLFL